MKINKIIVMLCYSFLLVHSIGYARYKSSPLSMVHQQIDVAAQESISFDYRVLSSNDCKKYFNSRDIIQKGYQPIQIVFINNSNNSIAISPASFSFRCAHAKDVANSLHRNGLWRGLGFGLGALIFIPLVIPALIQGCGADHYNDQMDRDFLNKAFKNQVVQPYSITDGVIFVSSDQFSRDFRLTVKSIDRNDLFTLSPTRYRLLV